MNKRGDMDDLLEFAFTIIVLVIVFFVAFLLKSSHENSVARAAVEYNNKIDTYYAVDNILRTPVEINGVKLSVAEFIALSVEEDSSFFKDLFGSSLKDKLRDKVGELVGSTNAYIGLSVSYGGESFDLYTPPLTSISDAYIEIVQLPSLKGGFIDLKVSYGIKASEAGGR